MCSPQTILDTIIGKITEAVIHSVWQHAGFLIHYKQNLKNLENKMIDLGEQRSNIEGKVDEARARGEVILANVSKWLNEADGIGQGVEEFMDKKTVEENMQCFKFSCPAFISRYRLSKQAVKKVGDINSLAEKGRARDFDIVSHPRQDPEELQFPLSAGYETYTSRDDVFKDIVKALKDTEVSVIGVFGTGGVGKTTMVEAIGKKLKNGTFDEVVIAVVSQNANVSEIQKQLAGQLNPKVELGTDENGRAGKLWNRLKHGTKKVLIILDDIWQQLNLMEIGIPTTDGNKSCKVLLTSRDQRVLKNMDVNRCFPIQVLSKDEAWDLFKKKVGTSVESDNQLRGIAHEVCDECQGLPVAILAVGAALKGKELDAWEDALVQLKESMPENIVDIDSKVYISLKWSYHRLEFEDAKSCFLLCCLFPEDAQIPIEHLVRHSMARRLLHLNPDTLEKARRRVRTVVDKLKTSCLLLEGRDENVVKMHDVIRDVAISIARDDEKLHFLIQHGVKEWDEKGNYEHCSAISLSSQTIRRLPDLVCPQLHTLLLDSRRSRFDFPLELSDSFFSGMEKLTVLHLKRVSMLPVLPSSLAKLKELRMLCLHFCKLGDLALLRDLRDKLEILSIRDYSITALPPEVGELTRLRTLDLSGCELAVIPKGVISKLSRLEELYILDSFDKWEPSTANKEGSNASLDELMSLSHLTTLEIQIPNVMLLPKDLDFRKLIRFKISVGDRLFEYDIDYSSTRNNLQLEDVPLKDEFNILLDRAEVLYLFKLKGLKKVFHDRGGEGFSNLKRLEVRNCDDLEHLIDGPSRSFHNLTELIIQGCRFKYLFSPACARGLLQLQRLMIQRCEIMEEVIGTEGEKDEEKLTNMVSFSQLKYLTLDDLPNLIGFYPKMEKEATIKGSSSSANGQSLFSEKVSLPALEEVEIINVPKITEIWDKKLLLQGYSCCQLQSLKVTSCEELENLLPSIMLPQLWNLGILSVDNCQKMEVIVVLEKSNEEEKAATIDNVILPKLRSLTLENLKTLRSFSTSRSEDQPLFSAEVSLPALEEIVIANVPNITEIWDKKLLRAESFRQLRSLMVMRCEKLVNLVPSIFLPQLQDLGVLQVRECLKMEVIIVLEKNKGEKKADDIDTIILLPKLRNLTLENLENLKSFCTSTSENQPLFNAQVSLPTLEDIKIDNVPNITELWDKKLFPAESFCQLQSLMVNRCKKLVNLVPSIDTIILLPKLRNLTLKNLANLKSFCPSTSANQPFLNAQVSLPTLEKIEIDNVPNTTELWDNRLLPAESFSQLQSLTVKRCEKLVNLALSIDTIILLPKLRNLTLENLANLKSFCTYTSANQPLFNAQVALPALKEIEIDNVPTITEIWDKKLLPAGSFCQLSSLEVTRCEKMVNVVPSCMLPRLQNLEILSVLECLKTEVIVVLEKSNEEKKVSTTDNIILLPKLSRLTLRKLENLKSFCTFSSEEQPVRNAQVALPKLEDPTLADYVNAREIHLSHVLACKRGLELLIVEECGQVSTSVLPFFRQCPNVDKLIVRNCQWEREDFQLGGLNVGEGQHVGPIIEVRGIELDTLPQLTCLWNKDPHGLPGLQNLQYLVIKNCSLLRNLFTPSVAMSLERLKRLCLWSCSAMKEVIATDEGHKEVIDHHEIVFPKLRVLILKNLSNLESFCSANYNFNLPSLRGVFLKRCPKMQTFTSGSVHMPKIRLHATRAADEHLDVEDLNKYLEQRLLKGEEFPMVDEGDDGGWEDRYAHL